MEELHRFFNDMAWLFDQFDGHPYALFIVILSITYTCTIVIGSMLRDVVGLIRHLPDIILAVFAIVLFPFIWLKERKKQP